MEVRKITAERPKRPKPEAPKPEAPKPVPVNLDAELERVKALTIEKPTPTPLQRRHTLKTDRLEKYKHLMLRS